MALDKTPALEALQVTEAELDELLREFVELSHAELAAICEGLEAGRLAGLDRWAHSIRGMAANLRLDQCRSRAHRLESTLLGLDAPGARAAIQALEQSLQEVSDAARQGNEGAASKPGT